MKPKTKELDIDIPQNPFDEVDDYDDDLYEDDLIDDLDVIIPPKVYLTSIIPNLNHSYVKKEWIKFVLNNMGEDEYMESVNMFCRSMKEEIQKKLWKRELQSLPKQTQKDKETMDFRKQTIEREGERLGNQILDDMNGWYDDMKFRMKGKKSEK
tara:strand:+ start:206 stop:667 length:462 start_codon:yes stop_codon:yes gene_type:complete